ncbi:MAG TPA: outer membrane lipoprotein-sorting protein, partial [Candidatus Angelobacter sp.]
MRRLTFIAVSAILFSLTLSAQTVDEIIAKHIAAQGGLAKLKAIQSIRMTGDFETEGMQAGFTQTFKRPMKMRLDISVQGLTMTQAYDVDKGWQVVPFTGKKDPEPMTGDELKNAQEQADIDGPLVDYKKKG